MMYILYSVFPKALTCVATHPSRPKTLATGSENGVVAVWDCRGDPKPTIEVEVAAACPSMSYKNFFLSFFI